MEGLLSTGPTPSSLIARLITRETSCRGDYLGYIPLVTGGHLKTSFLNSYAEVKRIKYCYRYMIIVIRKHTRQAPKHFDDRVGLAVS